jgi:tetratricopeptide (TPR) repeat protein
MLRLPRNKSHGGLTRLRGSAPNQFGSANGGAVLLVGGAGCAAKTYLGPYYKAPILNRNEDGLNPEIKEIETRLADLPEGDSTERVDLLIKLTREVFIEDQDRGNKACQDALRMARRLKYDKGIGYGLYLTGFGQYLMSDLEKAMATLLESEHILKAEGETNGLGLVNGVMSGIHLSLGDYEKALACSFEALKVHRKSGDRINEGWLLHGIGGGYHEMGDYPRALRYHEETLKVFEELDLDVGRGRAMTGIGTVYQSLREYDKALEYHRQSL